MPTTTPFFYLLPLLNPTSPPPTLSLTPTFNPTTTGTSLWPSARLLATHLLSLRPRDRRSRVKPRNRHDNTTTAASTALKVLDLGSGLGLAAMACAAGLGAHVVATDLEVVVEGLRDNVATNGEIINAAGGSVDVRVLDWSHALAKEESGEADGDDDAIGVEEFDWIVTSDTLYHEPLIPGLLATIDRYAGLKTVLWLAFERRDAQVEERAREALRRRGWRGKRVRVGKKVERDWENREEDGTGRGDDRNGENGQEGSGYDEDDGRETDEDGDEGLEDCEVWRWERVKVKKEKSKSGDSRKAGSIE